MQRPTILVLKAIIAAMILLILACQLFLVPPTAQGMARTYPEFADLIVPGIVIAELFLLCIQVVNLCVWRLLSMIGARNIFSTDAFRWVNMILASIVAATLLIASRSRSWRPRASATRPSCCSARSASSSAPGSPSSSSSCAAC